MTVLEAQLLFPVLLLYTDDEHEARIPYEVEDGEEVPKNMGEYRIVFDVAGNRFYCNVEAPSMNEALGIFFKNHPRFSYQMIVAHESA